MTDSAARTDVRHDLADDAIALVRRWLTESQQSAGTKRDPAAERLGGVLKDPDGLDFAVGFVDGVARPQDVVVAGYNLQRVARRIPRFLPWYMRLAISAGGALGPVIPWVVVPVARRVLRSMVGHLIVDATPAKLGGALEHLRGASGSGGEGGARLNLNLLGEAVLGDREAQRRLRGTHDLLARDDVDYVSIKVSSIVSQLNMWAFDEAVARVVERLTPLYELAARSATPKFINLDMEEYRDLHLTVAIFQRLLSQPQLEHLEAGIVLQAYLPDCLDALQTLTEWATERRAGGGAPIKVRIVKGANLVMERVDAELHDWPLATYPTKQDTDTNYLRVLDWALTPQHTYAVKIGVAGHNLFDVAWTWLLARQRGVDDRIDIEMLLGMATAQADAVSRTAGRLLLYTPVVRPAEFDVAISYLIRRLEENSSSDNYMSAVFELAEDDRVFEQEKRRFLASVAQFAADEGPHGLAPLPNRTQDRAREWQEADVAGVFRPPVEPAPRDEEAGLTDAVLGLERGGEDTVSAPVFRNEPDTDPSLPANRAWGRKILARVPTSTLGDDTVAAGRVTDREELDRVIRSVLVDGEAWGARRGFDRAAVLDRAALALSANRDRLLEVMASETGKTLSQADVEVSEAVDFAHYYAARARELDSVQGARFIPSTLIVVTPPWNFPVSIPAGNVLAALAAGSGVIIKPAPQARRSAAVMVEAIWEAGVPRELLAYVDIEEGELGKQLIADPRVDRVILTGSYETAELFRSWRPELPLLAETSGKNAIIVTPDADYDLAVADIVSSAFGHAGQKCSAASLVILVGSVGSSKRFLNQLVDAVSTLEVGYPTDPVTQMGPLVEPASGKLLNALTRLEAGEHWLVKPRQLDSTGRLWSPGVRTDVQPGSYTHRTEFFGPMVSILRARTLTEAIRLVNAVDYGLTSGLHSLNSDEIAEWVDTVEAGNLYVNRGITGAIVQRQPFGGWKRSTVGTGTKAGGPHHLFGLGGWVADTGRSSSSLHLRGLEPRVTELIEAGQPDLSYEDFDLVRRSVLSDQVAWATEYGVVRDATGLACERNLLRYLPVPVSIRLAEGGSMAALLRTLAAATLTRSRYDVSVPTDLPAKLTAVLAERAVPVVVESDADWLVRVARREQVALDTLLERPAPDRIRLLGGDPVRAAYVLGGTPDVAIHALPATPAGRIDLLPFLREQAISITNHRFGNPTTLTDEVL